MDSTALSVAAAAQAIREGTLSAERYAEALLERCAAHAGLNAFITLDADVQACVRGATLQQRLGVALGAQRALADRLRGRGDAQRRAI
ncbi:MAG: hypothetical protein ACREVQ_08340, partial [Burkholderiales bacterium]